MAVRGDSTLMDASSASGGEFPYGVFPSSKSLKGRWRSTWARGSFFSLMVVSIWPDGTITALTASQQLGVSIRSIAPAMVSP